MIPAATTTVTWKAASEPEPGEGRTFSTRASGVRAVISSPNGRAQGQAGGGREVIDAVLNCDPVSGEHTDLVVDDTTGETWEVVWVEQRKGLGVDHTRAGLKRVAGVV